MIDQNIQLLDDGTIQRKYVADKTANQHKIVFNFPHLQVD